MAVAYSGGKHYFDVWCRDIFDVVFYSVGYVGSEYKCVAAYRGAYNNSMRIGDGTIRLEEALFLPDNTYVYNTYGLDWNRISLAD